MDGASEAESVEAVRPEQGARLPAEALAALDGQLRGQAIVAWAEFDLDADNRYCRSFAILTEEQLLIVRDGQTVATALKEIDEAAIVEGLGVDSMNLLAGGKLAASLRYSRRWRRDMTRLHRKLQRRLDARTGKQTPEWLEAAEREAEKLDHCAKCGLLIPAYAEGVCPQCLQKRRILWRLLDVARPYRIRTWSAVGLTMLAAGLGTLPPLCSKQIIDTAIAPHAPLTEEVRLANLAWWGAASLVLILSGEFLGGLRLRIMAIVGTSLTRDLRHGVYAHLHELSLRYFAKRRTGSLITRVTNDTDRLWDFIVFGAVNLVSNAATIVAIAVVMFTLSWRLALVALLPLPILAVITYYRGMKMQAIFGRLWTYWARMTAVVGDALPGVRVVKAFANEKREVDRFDRRSEEYTQHEIAVNKVWSALQPVVSGIMRLGALTVWMAGGWMIIRHTGGTEILTLGMLMAFSQYMWGFYGPIMEIANSNRMVTRAATSAQRVFEVLDTPPEIYSRRGALTKSGLEGRVELRNVSFSYEGAQPALREVSTVIEPGQMIGLCGPSGAGKSTLVNLLCRFYDVTDGQILIDGQDVRDYDVSWLRRQIGMVLQEPYLFHGTVADNIRYGNPDASNEKVIAAARAANAHDFVVGFPDGYDTMVGERGQSLSGGERQRISIARAILHDPRILILDEATSSVDTETERQIQQALDRLVKGRTTLAIAHRLSTLRAADRLIVLEKGKIVEQGTHDELVAKEGGVYAKLHNMQIEMNSLRFIA